MEDLLKLDACRSAHPLRLPVAREEVHTPLKWQEWDRSLAGHPDQRFRRYIVDGIKDGFRIGFDYSRSPPDPQLPLESTLGRGAPGDSEGLLGHRVQRREWGAPLDPAQFPAVHSSRFGVIPKSTPGEWRHVSPGGR